MSISLAKNWLKKGLKVAIFMSAFLTYAQSSPQQYDYGRFNDSGKFESWAEVQLFDNGEFRYKSNTRRWFEPEFSYGQYEISSDTILLRYYSQIEFGNYHFETVKTPRSDSTWTWTFETYSYQDREKPIDSIDMHVYFTEFGRLMVDIDKEVHTGEFELFSQKAPGWEECWAFSVNFDYQWPGNLDICTDGIIRDTSSMFYKTRASSVVELGVFCHAEFSSLIVDGVKEPLLTDYNYHTKMMLITDLTDTSFYNYLALHGIPLFDKEVKCVLNDSMKSIIRQ